MQFADTLILGAYPSPSSLEKRIGVRGVCDECVGQAQLLKAILPKLFYLCTPLVKNSLIIYKEGSGTSAKPFMFPLIKIFTQWIEPKKSFT